MQSRQHISLLPNQIRTLPDFSSQAFVFKPRRLGGKFVRNKRSPSWQSMEYLQTRLVMIYVYGIPPRVFRQLFVCFPVLAENFSISFVFILAFLSLQHF